MESPCILSEKFDVKGVARVRLEGRTFYHARLLMAQKHGLHYDDKTWWAKRLCKNRSCINLDHYRLIDEHLIRDFVEDHHDTWSTKEIANKFGVSTSVVLRVKDELKVSDRFL